MRKCTPKNKLLETITKKCSKNKKVVQNPSILGLCGHHFECILKVCGKSIHVEFLAWGVGWEINPYRIPGHFEGSLKLFWRYSEAILNVLWRHFEGMLKVVWNCVEGRYSEAILNVLLMYSEGILKAFWRYFECSLKVFWRYFGWILKVFCRYSAGVLNAFWRYV